MATVADIEPSSLTLTPGQAQVLTLSVRNDGDEVEAYHLSVVDDAADHVDIEPDTLLVHPGETATATATVLLEHTGRWSVGDLIVRFHIVPAVRPDEYLVVEAIAAIQSFSDVAAVLSPPVLQGRRSAEAEIAIANAGNAHAYADVAVSAGELAVSIDRAHAALPASSTESVELRVRARSLLWRGEPVQHPFVVTVTPEGEPAISLDGTFTQLPVLPGWAFKAAIAVAAAAALLLVLWLGAVFWGNLGGAASATEDPTETATETATATAEPVAVAVSFDQAEVTAKGGDTAVATLGVDIEGAPEAALVAIAVEWSPQLALVEHSCWGWVDPKTDEQLEDATAQPASGDECLVDPADDPTSAITLTFTTPPAGFTGTVSAAATRLLAIGENDDVEVLEPETEPLLSAAELPIEAAPYPFWMDIEVLAPTTADADDGVRRAVIGVHRTLGPQGTNERATIAFRLTTPDFAEPPDLNAVRRADGQRGCDRVAGDEVCILDFLLAEDLGAVTGDLRDWEVPLTFAITDDSNDAGLIVVEGASLSVGGEEVSEGDLDEQIQAAAAPLVIGADDFPVEVDLERTQTESGDRIDATIELQDSVLPADASARDGSRMIDVTLSWSDGLQPGEPEGCADYDADERVCTLPASTDGDLPEITMSFRVDEDTDPERVAVAGKGAMLTYAPADGEEFADELTDDDLPAGLWPLRWTASDVAALDLD